jgi:hypothetical protein
VIAAPVAAAGARRPLAIAVATARHDAVPECRGADLLSSCSPFNSQAIASAIERLIERLSISHEESSDPGEWRFADILPGVAATGAALAVAEAVLRRCRAARGGADEQSEPGEEAGFPGLPGAHKRWALEER